MEDFYRELNDLINRITNSIIDLLNETIEKEIKIPYFADEIDDDISTLINDGYIVKINENGENLSVYIDNGIIEEKEIVSAYLNDRGVVVLIDKTSNLYLLSDLININDLLKIHDFLVYNKINNYYV